MLKGTNKQVFEFAVAAGIVTGKEKAKDRPTKEDLGEQLAGIIFPGYDWESPQSRKKQHTVDSASEEDTEDAAEDGDDDEDTVDNE